MKILAGTSGYSYKEWKGIFYPEDLPDKEMLKFYAQQLPAVEINNTFYRMPKADMLESWAEQVPANFQFILKASRKITHIKRLKECEDETAYLFKTASTLGKRLGAILFQLPPFLRKDATRLKNFLKLIPAKSKAAFEFRHETWFDEEIYECLKKKSCALCFSDTENNQIDELVSTAPWGYLRLRKPGYSENELMDWIKKIKAQDWDQALIFFKHEDEGAGPKMAKHFLTLADTI
jgi:uncharacterized protein YecE (DUF72 family)